MIASNLPFPFDRAERPECNKDSPRTRSSFLLVALLCPVITMSRKGRDVALSFQSHRELVLIAAGRIESGVLPPPQISFAPLTPKRRHLHSPFSDGFQSPLGVPALHRLDRQSIADFHAVNFNRRRQRRCRPMRNDVGAPHADDEGLEIHNVKPAMPSSELVLG